MRIGFVGVGRGGGLLARNLIRAGLPVLVHDRSPAAVAGALAAGTTGRAARSPADLAGCDLLCTCLPLPRHVEEVMLEPGGLLGRLRSGAIHLECSTVAPQTSVRLEAAAKAGGCRYLQCAMGRTPAHDVNAQGVLFVGGDKAVFDELAALWPLLGGAATYMGTVEAACAITLIQSMVGMANLAVLAEAIRIGEKASIDPSLLLTLLRDTEAGSFQMDMRGPWIAADDFAVRFGLGRALKDCRLGCEMAVAWGMKIPAMLAALDALRRADAAGLENEDCNAVYKITQ